MGNNEISRLFLFGMSLVCPFSTFDVWFSNIAHKVEDIQICRKFSFFPFFPKISHQEWKFHFFSNQTFFQDYFICNLAFGSSSQVKRVKSQKNRVAVEKSWKNGKFAEIRHDNFYFSSINVQGSFPRSLKRKSLKMRSPHKKEKISLHSQAFACSWLLGLNAEGYDI